MYLAKIFLYSMGIFSLLSAFYCTYFYNIPFIDYWCYFQSNQKPAPIHLHIPIP